MKTKEKPEQDKTEAKLKQEIEKLERLGYMEEMHFARYLGYMEEMHFARYNRLRGELKGYKLGKSQERQRILKIFEEYFYDSPEVIKELKQKIKQEK